MKTNFRRAFVVMIFSFLILVATVSPALGHSQIVSSNPSNGESLKSSPEEIEIVFSENISTNPNSIRLLNERGERIALNGSIETKGSKLIAPIVKLSRGTYVVAWSVTSEDTHPIKGAFSFSVDSVLKTDVSTNKELSKIFDGEVGNKFQVNVFAVFRFLILMSLAMIIALIVIKSFLIEGEIPSTLNKLFKIFIYLCMASSLGAFIVQAALANGISILDVINRETIMDQFDTRYGFVSVVRILLCIGLSFTWTSSKHFVRLARVATTIALASTLAFSGHAIAGKFVVFSVLFDVVHVLAASIWIGGVITLPLFLKSDSGIAYAKKFSKVAIYCVSALIASGVFAWWRQVGSLQAATSTWFGQLVSFKSFAVVFLIVIACFSRKLVSNFTGSSSTLEKNRFVKLLYIESVVLVLILVATTVLINTIPARTALALPVSRSISVDTGYLEVTVDPAKVGPTLIHVYMLNENGTPYPALDTGVSLNNEIMKATWTNEERDVAALPIEMKFQGLNHFVSVGSNLPFAGNWTLTIRIQIDSFNVIIAETNFKVRN